MTTDPNITDYHAVCHNTQQSYHGHTVLWEGEITLDGERCWWVLTFWEASQSPTFVTYRMLRKGEKRGSRKLIFNEKEYPLRRIGVSKRRDYRQITKAIGRAIKVVMDTTVSNLSRS